MKPVTASTECENSATEAKNSKLESRIDTFDLKVKSALPTHLVNCGESEGVRPAEPLSNSQKSMGNESGTKESVLKTNPIRITSQNESSSESTNTDNRINFTKNCLSPISNNSSKSANDKSNDLNSVSDTPCSSSESVEQNCGSAEIEIRGDFKAASSKADKEQEMTTGQDQVTEEGRSFDEISKNQIPSEKFKFVTSSKFSPKSKPFVPKCILQNPKTRNDPQNDALVDSTAEPDISGRNKSFQYTMDPYTPRSSSSLLPTPNLYRMPRVTTLLPTPRLSSIRPPYACPRHSFNTFSSEKRRPISSVDKVDQTAKKEQGIISSTNNSSSHKSPDSERSTPEYKAKTDKVVSRTTLHKNNLDPMNQVDEDPLDCTGPKIFRHNGQNGFPFLHRGIRPRGKYLSRLLTNYSYPNRGAKHSSRYCGSEYFDYPPPFVKKPNINISYMERDGYRDYDTNCEDSFFDNFYNEGYPVPMDRPRNIAPRGRSLYHHLRYFHPAKRGGFGQYRENEDYPFSHPQLRSGSPPFHPFSFRFRGRRNGYRHFGSFRGGYGRCGRFKRDNIPKNNDLKEPNDDTGFKYKESTENHDSSPIKKSTPNYLKVELELTPVEFEVEDPKNEEDFRGTENTGESLPVSVPSTVVSEVTTDIFSNDLLAPEELQTTYYTQVAEMDSEYAQSASLGGCVGEACPGLPEVPIFHSQDHIPYENYVEAISNPPAFVLTPEHQAQSINFQSIPFPGSTNNITATIEIESNNVDSSNPSDEVPLDFHQEFINGNLEDYEGIVNEGVTEPESGHVVHFHINPGTTVNFTTSDGKVQRVSGEYLTVSLRISS